MEQQNTRFESPYMVLSLSMEDRQKQKVTLDMRGSSFSSHTVTFLSISCAHLLQRINSAVEVEMYKRRYSACSLCALCTVNIICICTVSVISI